MPTDPNIEEARIRVNQHETQTVLGPVDESDRLGVHGTQVEFDFDGWNADGTCLEDCPVDTIEVDPRRAGRV